MEVEWLDVTPFKLPLGSGWWMGVVFAVALGMAMELSMVRSWTELDVDDDSQKACGNEI